MDSQGFRYRNSEAQRPSTSTGQHLPSDRTREGVQTAAPPSAPPSPVTPSRQLPFPEAADLGSAASLFQIAQSRVHPDPGSALEALKARVKKTLESDAKISTISPRTTVRDILTTSDSLWIPTLKLVAIVLVCALLAAAIYGIVQLLQPAHPQPAAVAATAYALLSSF